MIPIADAFRYDGFDFRLLKRQGRVCLLEKGKPHHRRKSYEVVRLRIYPDKVIEGRSVPAHEAMPCSEDWGSDGFTYCDMEGAERKFAALCGGRKAITADHHRTAPPSVQMRPSAASTQLRGILAHDVGPTVH